MFLWVFPLVILVIVGIFLSLWGWTVYLETAKPVSVRRALHIINAIVSLIEVIMW